MSANLIHPKGFFPFYEYDATALSDAQLAAASLIELPIVIMSQLWWLSKTFDWACNITFTPPVGPVITSTGSGTVVPFAINCSPGSIFIGDTSIVTPRNRTAFASTTSGTAAGLLSVRLPITQNPGAIPTFIDLGFFAVANAAGSNNYFYKRTSPKFAFGFQMTGAGAIFPASGTLLSSTLYLALTVAGATANIPLAGPFGMLAGTFSVNVNNLWNV